MLGSSRGWLSRDELLERGVVNSEAETGSQMNAMTFDTRGKGADEELCLLQRFEDSGYNGDRPHGKG